MDIKHVLAVAAAATTLAAEVAAADDSVMQGIPPAPETQVTFGNYREHPFSTWAFRNVGGPLNVLMIPRGGALRAFSSAPIEDLGRLEVEDKQGVVRPLDDVLADSFTDGFLVLKGDDVLYERYFNGLTADYQHIWFSATKSLTSSALGILVEEGKVDLQASPADYIPELKGSGFERVTIQNVLDHSSGIDFKENYADPESNFIKYYGPANNMAWIPGARDAQPGGTPIYGVHDFLSQYIKPDMAVTPGDVFDYNSVNADVAGWLIARISGQPWERFVQQRIWSRLGAEHDAYVSVDRAYMAVATGGMNSTLRDFARFGSMILNRGRSGGQQVIPASWVDASLQVTARDRSKMDANDHYTQDPWVAYRNMWWILDPDKGEYCAVGIHGQVCYLNRDKGVVIAFFSSQPVASNANNPPFGARLRAARRIASAL